MTSTGFDSIVISGRAELRRNLKRCVTSAAGPLSFAVYGLPGFCAEIGVDEALAQAATRPDVTVYRLKIGSRVPMQIATDMLTFLENRSGSSVDPSFATIISGIVSATKKIEERTVVVVIEDFHQFAELRKTHEEEVQDLLDCLQAACTEGQRIRVVACSRVQPVRVCASVGWSDFYKVFGIHIYRAGLLDSGWVQLAKQLLNGNGVTSSDAVLRELEQLAGGVPDFVVELLAYLNTGSVVEGDLTRMALASAFFGDRRRAMLDWLPQEAREFFTEEGWKEVTPLTRQWAHECRSLGLLVEREGQFELPTALLALPTQTQSHSATVTSFVHHEQLVSDELRPLVRKLCADTHYTKIKTIQNRPGEAHVLHLTRELPNGRSLPPRIIKLWSRSLLEKERKKHALAQQLLGASCPQLIGFETKGAYGALLIQYACADNRYYDVCTFADLYRVHTTVQDKRPNDSGGRPWPDPADVVERLLGRVLAGLYRNSKPKRLTLAGSYRPPVQKKDKDELADLTELSHGTGFLSEDGEVLVIGSSHMPEPGRFLAQHRQKLFQSRVPTLVCDPVHGDLNVRNFLVDGAGNIHVIDFSTFDEGPLLRDFARLECEVLLKLTRVSDLPKQVELFKRILAPNLMKAAQDMLADKLDEPMRTTVKIIAAIRGVASEYINEANTEDDYDAEMDYLGGLVATSGRLALFLDYLEKEQLATALAFTSLAASRLYDCLSEHGC